jgi:(S)-2-hydroxyglutarate dehydrogenase
MLYDFIVVGGGVVGLATAMELLAARPGASLLLLEKEPAVARHQTGRNSGVIHAGIYYAPGSLKAELCRRGAIATKEFCDEHGIRYETCGKLLVATDDLEMQRMAGLEERARLNGIPIERLDAGELRAREPNIAGKGALLVTSTGIVNYSEICHAILRVIERAGGAVHLGCPVTAIREQRGEVTVVAGAESQRGRQLVVCGGLQSDRLARLAGLGISHRIVPFRGEYYRLPPHRNGIVRSLIYPIPDPELPFLGIHLTRMIDGGVTVGPNAVLGLAREGYHKLEVNLRDVVDFAGFPGFWKVAAKHRRSGVMEWRNSLFPRFYLEACRKYCPDLTVADLLPEAAGIRAQAVTSTGELVHDFLFLETERMLHVCNAPSPAATSAIPIARMIVEKCLKRAA